MTTQTNTTSRRDFLRTAAGGITALTILPSSVIAGLGHSSPSDKMNIAAIGVGGVGFRNLTHIEHNNIVALCDVDWDFATKSFRRWSRATRYRDFRIMLDNEKNIDAVLIATPDHTHSVAAMAAMQLQKHIYVQAPMAHSVFEARRMSETARMYNLVTQVGSQSVSADNVRDITEILWEGIIGPVTKVDAWTHSPEWKQGLKYPEESQRVPRDLDWDLFLGPANEIPYHSTYTPYGWRAWWKFGNGAPGSIAPHLLQPVFHALKLDAPEFVEASSTQMNLQSAPVAQKIVFEFARRDNLPRLAMPRLLLSWYDGGLRPETPVSIHQNVDMNNYPEGVIFYGEKGLLICGIEGQDYKIILDGKIENFTPQRKLYRVDNALNGGHENDWLRACKENPDNRLMPLATLANQLALTETILVGNMAVRLQSLRKKLEWNSAQMRFVNINNYEEFTITQKSDVFIQNGIPKFEIKTTAHNASHFVEKAVRPVYRSGWQQI